MRDLEVGGVDGDRDPKRRPVRVSEVVVAAGYMMVICPFAPSRVWSRVPASSNRWRRAPPRGAGSREWLECEPVWIPEPTERHQRVLESLMRAVVDRPKLVPDAHLAALAIGGGWQADPAPR
jgi:hypothetical protein